MSSNMGNIILDTLYFKLQKNNHVTKQYMTITKAMYDRQGSMNLYCCIADLQSNLLFGYANCL
jgi:hypothetical protein